MMKLRAWLRARLAHDTPPLEDDWTLLHSTFSAGIGEMYADVLRKSGVPVLVKQWGGGTVLVGGAPMGLSLYVPRSRVDEARDVLGLDEAGEQSEEIDER